MSPEAPEPRAEVTKLVDDYADFLAKISRAWFTEHASTEEFSRTEIVFAAAMGMEKNIRFITEGASRVGVVVLTIPIEGSDDPIPEPSKEVH